MGWFHRTLCDLLDSFLADVVGKRSPRLLVQAPPQHGKSELVSRRFPAFALGKHPHLRLIATSYGASLAFDLSSDVQRIMDSDAYHRLFPSVVIPGQFGIRGSSTRRLETFGIIGHGGSYRAAGVDGAVTGKSAEVLLVDDPFKNYLEAHSLAIRDGIWKNFTTALRTRVQDGGGILIVSTRWHLDDLAGRLREREGGRWQVCSYPAIAVEDEEHRRAGEALSPDERFSLATLEELRDSMGDYLWNALYQQNPAPEGGGMLKRHCWRYWQPVGYNLPAVSVVDDKGAIIEIAPETLPEQFNRHVQSWDLSFTGSATSDYVCGLDVRTAGPKRFIIDVVHKRMDFPATLAAVAEFQARHRPDGVYVERAANGAAVIDTLQQRLPAINAVVARRSKIDRATAASASLTAGDWCLPHPQFAPWVNEFLFEVSAFPNGKNDDYVDAWSQAGAS